MKIETTITAIKDGICLFETDVICSIDYHVDRYDELEWHVDEYSVEGTRRYWDDTAQKWVETKRTTAVPDALAEIFDKYLDREWMEKQIRENLADYGDDQGDYLRDLMMDR